jgi:hypothetical protein
MDELCGLRRLTVELAGRRLVVRQAELESRALVAVEALRRLRGGAWESMLVGERHAEVLFRVLLEAFQARFGEPSLLVVEDAALAAESLGHGVSGCRECLGVLEQAPVAQA